MRYVWKPWEELTWGVAIAVIVYVAGELVLFNAAAIADWRTWAIALLSGAIRAAAGAFIALVTQPKP